MPRIAQSLQSSLDAAGFHVQLVPATQSDFYGKYLEAPATAKRGVWDLAAAGWIPDWFGNNGRSTIVPLLTQPGLASNDFGGYTSPKVESYINAALSAPDAATAAQNWQKADATAMQDVANIPINVQKWPIFHSARRARVQLLLVRPQLRPDQRVAQRVMTDTVAPTADTRERTGSDPGWRRPPRDGKLHRSGLPPALGLHARGLGTAARPDVTAGAAAGHAPRPQRPAARGSLPARLPAVIPAGLDTAPDERPVLPVPARAATTSG